MNFTITRGDSRTLSGAVTLSGEPFNLTSCDIWFTVKYRYTDDDDDAVFQKTVGDGITVTNPTAGLITIDINPADTEDIPKVKTILVYDLQIKNSGGSKWTSASGNIVVNPDVTHA